MPLKHLPKKPNIVLIITDQEREVRHWPDGWAEANLPARSPPWWTSYPRSQPWLARRNPSDMDSRART